MSIDLADRPRRGRPPVRNEILRAGRLAGHDPSDLAERFGTPLYVYDLDTMERQRRSASRPAPPLTRFPTEVY